MALSKVTYVDGVTIIGAKNLNDIQDELIRQGEQQAEDEEELALKANATDVQTALALKADKSDTYTKAEVNEALGLKVNTADVNEALALKADKTETYTKAQVDSIVEDAIAEAVKESEYSNFEMKSVSGDFIHITDGAGLIPVKDLKIGIDAAQDLHGYDAPWVGGAGVNKVSEDVIGYTPVMLSSPIPANTPFCASAVVTGEDTPRIYIFDANGTRIDYYNLNATASNGRKYRNLTLEADAYSVYFTTNCSSVQIALETTITDYYPYANICPISGWTGAKVTRMGRNLWDDSIAPTNIEAYSLSGNKGTYKGRNLYLPQGTYKFSFNGTTIAYIYGNVVNTDGSWVSTFQLTVGSSSVQPPTFTLSDGQYAKLFVASGSETELTSGKIQLELGSTATAYEPYDGHVYSVTWQTEAGTVYGGVLDVTTGELVVTHQIVDLGDLNWNDQSIQTQKSYYSEVISNAMQADANFGKNAISSCYKLTSSSNFAGNGDGRFIISSGKRINCNDNRFENANAFKTGIAGETVMYKLVEPITFTIDPTEVLTLLGENNIFADTGAVEELIYRISRQ